MAVAAPYLVYAFAAFVLGKLAQSLLTKKQRPEIDGKKPTLSSRGAYIPILIGTRQVSPITLWVGDRTTTEEGHAGGKGTTGGGGSQLVYRESAWHALCIGPARELYRIRENDKIIWDAGGSADIGVTAETYPSGSTISVPGHGSFRIFWGEQDQPVNGRLGDSDRVGYDSRHSFLCYIEWIQKRLGGVAVWPQLEYEIEVRPYKVGDTYAYRGNYEGQFGLPERLSQSLGWLRNGIGPIGGLLPILTAVDGDPGIIKLAGNVIPFGGVNKAEIIDNSALADGRYDLDSVVYNASEQLRAPSDVYVEIPGTQADFNTWTLGANVTSIAADATAALPPNAVPPGFTPNSVYKVILVSPHTGIREITFDISGLGGNVDLSPGINHIKLYVRGFNDLNFDQIRVQLYAYNHPSLGDRTHELQFDADASGVPIITRTNGAYGTIDIIGQTTPGGGPSQDWWKLDFYYRSGTGSSPSNQNWDRRLKIRFINDNATAMWLYANDPLTIPSHIGEDALLSDDDGTSVTGITTLLTTQPLSGSNYSVGEVQFLRAGSGHSGANIAHTIDQLLFEPHPHGVGMSRSLFDLDALEEVGVTLGVEEEGLRTHVLVEDGGTLEDTLGKIMLDIGLQMPWDPVQGKHTFKLIRDPTTTPINIPAGMVHAPLPQITITMDAAMPDKKIYMFKDRDANYRDAPAPTINDDGRSSRDDRQNAKTENLFIVTDFDAAAQVAARRELYETAPPTAYDIYVGRASRRLIPGIPLTVEGIDERLRLMEVGPIEQTSTKVKIKCLTDIYTAPPPDTDS